MNQKTFLHVEKNLIFLKVRSKNSGIFFYYYIFFHTAHSVFLLAVTIFDSMYILKIHMDTFHYMYVFQHVFKFRMRSRSVETKLSIIWTKY
jgi:hypothetical protein